ncbi:TPA: hypothetical protein ACU3EB_000639 [Salmonella enterica]
MGRTDHAARPATGVERAGAADAGHQRQYGDALRLRCAVDPLGLTATVGRWMGPAEYQQMLDTGTVVQSSTGTTHVAYPADIDAFGKQAKNGAMYVEFDVPEKSLVPTNEGWAKTVGPDSIEGRLAKRKDLPVPEMPTAENITVRGEKINGEVEAKC